MCTNKNTELQRLQLGRRSWQIGINAILPPKLMLFSRRRCTNQGETMTRLSRLQGGEQAADLIEAHAY